MLTTKDVAGILGIHQNTVRRWSDLGLLRSFRISRRGDRRYRYEDVTSFLDGMNDAVHVQDDEPVADGDLVALAQVIIPDNRVDIQPEVAGDIENGVAFGDFIRGEYITHIGPDEDGLRFSLGRTRVWG